MLGTELLMEAGGDIPEVVRSTDELSANVGKK
jgi:hypothetical protein